MFRHIFIPTADNHIIPSVIIPQEWYGREVEVIVFPVKPAKEIKQKSKEERLVELCGAWISEKSAEEIVSDIYNSRTSGKTRILEKI